MFDCRGPSWRADDFSRCFQRDYLLTLFPLILVLGSFLYLLTQLYSAARDSKYSAVYKTLDRPHIWSIRVPHEHGEGGYDTETDEFERNEELALAPTTSHATKQSVVQDRPTAEVALVLIEELAVLGELAIHVFALITHESKVGTTADIAGVVVWSYVAILASSRLLLSASSRFSFPKLWYHTAFLYTLLWIPSLLIFRSTILYPKSTTSRNLVSIDFALVSLLMTIALTTRKGNKSVDLVYEDDLEPSKEQTASVLSLATFAWVDAIVWKGYRKAYEMEDVWNLVPKDKAAAVLADYRQVARVTKLTWHLLRYFRRALIIQALWAAFGGFLTFAPTVLLKAILEYVERPDMTPIGAAWFYVILLFASGCASALADGQALWVGRRVCIKLRAIIIGEIYAKALKRRAASGTDKILGEGAKKSKEQQNEPRGIRRVLTFGKRKRKTSEEIKAEEADAAAAAEAQVTSGAIINLMAIDTFKVAEIGAYLHFLWANTPVQVVLAICLLYKVMGYSSIAGIGMMAFLLPINIYISRQFSVIQKKILAATDGRIHATNEVLSNIRIIKYFAWEQRFIGQIDEKRAVELKHLRLRYTFWAIAATVWSGGPMLITFLSFFIYTVVEKKALVPSVAFTALSLFQILRIPLDQLADMIANVQQSKVSLDRIEEYLNEPETEKYKQLDTRAVDDLGEPVIGFEDATFTWGGRDLKTEENADAFKMIDLNAKFRVGALNVIAGPTGSGKTSLLMALLGEMTILKGSVYLPGGRSKEDLKLDPETGFYDNVAYCAQQAWLVNDNIKENILFANPWDPKRYQSVIKACSLERDLDILDEGDQTLVGEKGVTLSGGQKQRISLARALYSKARHVILDDVLSAVDSHTAKWIFENALMGPLMYNRTCVLVTHNTALCLPHAEYAILLEGGKITADGTPDELIESGKVPEEIAKSRPASRGASRNQSQIFPGVVEEEVLGETDGSVNDDSQHSGIQLKRTASSDAQVPLNGNGSSKLNGTTHKGTARKNNALNESKAEGKVQFSIIFLYLKSMGGVFFWTAAAVVFVAQQLSSVATNIWIRQWAKAYLNDDVSASNYGRKVPVTHATGISSLGTCLRSGACMYQLPFFPSENTDGNVRLFSTHTDGVNAKYYLMVYAILGAAFMCITLFREGVLFGGSLAASRRIHTRLIHSITHAKFRFFDSTPLGQIMNRFSKDIESIDQQIAPVAIGVIHCLASILTIFVLISIITPGFLIAGFFISILYFAVGKFYIRSSRDLKRLESVQRSPLYQQFGETLVGMTTIRAYGDERRFIRENFVKVNTQSRPFIYLWAANRWLAFRVDVIGALVSFFAGVFVILSVGKIDAGAAGLAMTYAVTFTENVLWFVRLYSENEQNMNSVERIKEYLDVEQEAPSVTDVRPASNWPSQGSVEFINYSTRYRPDFDKVLKNITFKILPGEKVGVVGRTGAGKSSLALALFRALEAEEGKILIDDIDVGLIGLRDLRENIVMVPQDPTLFSGTVRSNLDPFELFTDEEIYTALRGVQLIGSTVPSTRTATSTMPGTPTDEELDRNIALTEGGLPVPATTHPSSIVLFGGPNSVPDSGQGVDLAATLDSTTTIVGSTSSPQPPKIAENKNLFHNLSSPVAESGTNLSQGQRQLLCLARAMLKEPKVLLMDEATASIDYATDAKIQMTIRELKNTTITIAHRLQTIIDYDKVLVLDRGEVMQYGSPYDLIREKNGQFRDMCIAAGEGELENLEKEAKKAWEGRRLIDTD